MQWLYQIVRHALASWGYFAVALGLTSESLGLPLPGETVLVFASFLAHKSTHLRIYWIIPIGIAATVVGDNIGYWLGRKFGPALIRWVKTHLPVDEEDVRAAKDLIRRRGWWTIFFARYIFGLRTIAGPVAGSLGMEWKSFLQANVLGAASWVSLIAVMGYLFANAFSNLLKYFEDAGWAISAGLFTVGYIFWRRQKKKFAQRQHDHHRRAA